MKNVLFLILLFSIISCQKRTESKKVFSKPHTPVKLSIDQQLELIKKATSKDSVLSKMISSLLMILF